MSNAYERDAKRARPWARWFIWVPIVITAAAMWWALEQYGSDYYESWRIDADALRELIR